MAAFLVKIRCINIQVSLRERGLKIYKRCRNVLEQLIFHKPGVSTKGFLSLANTKNVSFKLSYETINICFELWIIIQYIDFTIYI